MKGHFHCAACSGFQAATTSIEETFCEKNRSDNHLFYSHLCVRDDVVIAQCQTQQRAAGDGFARLDDHQTQTEASFKSRAAARRSLLHGPGQ